MTERYDLRLHLVHLETRKTGFEPRNPALGKQRRSRDYPKGVPATLGHLEGWDVLCNIFFCYIAKI